LPALGRNPINPEDAVSDGEATHTSDCVRYGCTARPLTVDLREPSLDFKPEPTLTPDAIIKRLTRGRNPGSRYR
jgi:hypothetical protein